MPCAIIGDKDPEYGAHCIDSDNAWGTLQATEYLISRGHISIAYLHVNRVTQDTAERLDSFRQVLSENGLPFPEEWLLKGDFSKASGIGAVRTVASMKVPPTALVCCTDLMALGVLEGIGRRAATLVINQIRGESDRPEHVVFPVVFEPRGSIRAINSA